MATLTVKQAKTKTHQITIQQENTLLIVSASPIIDENLVGYPHDKRVYFYTDTKNANATFKRYIKKYL